ncbi:unnamed protein product, partial [Symbiodinium necroappetens]
QRQRLEEVRRKETATEGSLLAEHLLQKWSWGEMSAQDIQAIADLAVQDSEQKRDLTKLKELGAAGLHGKYANKVYQAVYKTGAQGIRLPTPFLVKVPFKNPWGMMLQAVMLPHVLFSSIYASYRATWEKSICPNLDALERFWNVMVESKNPNITPAMTRKKNWKRRLIPLALHGDGVPITGLGKSWVQTVTNFAWYSLLTMSTSTADSLFFVYAMVDKMRVDAKDLTGHSSMVFGRQLTTWVESILAEFLVTCADPYDASSIEGQKAGKPLAAGYCAVLFSLVGDLDYYATILDVARSTSVTAPCSRCRATKYGDMSWQDFRPAANWMSSAYSPAGWKALPAADKSTCPLFHMPWTSICNLGYDYMHCKYLGVDRISMFFRAQKKSLSLRGKAAENRSLARPLLAIWAARMTAGIAVHRKLHLLLKLNWRLEELLEVNKFEFAFAEADANAFRDAMTGFLLLQKELSQHFSDHDPKLFNYTEKSHFLQHLGLE